MAKPRMMLPGPLTLRPVAAGSCSPDTSGRVPAAGSVWVVPSMTVGLLTAGSTVAGLMTNSAAGRLKLIVHVGLQVVAGALISCRAARTVQLPPASAHVPSPG